MPKQEVTPDYFTAIGWYLGRQFRFYEPKSHEIAVYTAAGSALGSIGSALVEFQLLSLNHWYRHCKGQYVVPISRPLLETQPLPREHQFPLQPSDHTFPAAVVTLESKSGPPGNLLRAEVWAVDGQFGCIIFDKPPASIFRSRNPNPNDIIVREVSVFINPLAADACPLVPMQNLNQLPSFFLDWHERWTLKDLVAPIPETLRNQLVAFYDAQLPDSYLDIVSHAEEFTLGCCKVFGLASANAYVTPRESVYVIGEVQGCGYFCLIRRAAPAIYFIDHEDHIPIPVGDSIAKLMEDVNSAGAEIWRQMRRSNKK